MTYFDYIIGCSYASAESICDDVFGRVRNFDCEKAEKFLKNGNAWNSDWAEFGTEELRQNVVNEVEVMYSANYTTLTRDMFKRHGTMFYTSDCEIEVEVAPYDFEYFHLDDESEKSEFESKHNVDLDFEFNAIEKMCDAQTENEVRGIINL